MHLTRNTRIVLLASIVGVTPAIIFLSVHYHSRSLPVVTTILALGIGLLCTNLWPDWPRPIRHLGPVMLTIALVVNLYKSWVKKEIILGVCWAAIILFGVVAYVRKLRLQRSLEIRNIGL